MNGIFQYTIPVLRTINEILTATIAITSFSLFLFALLYVQKERLAQVFVLIMICLTIIFSSDSIGSTVSMRATQEIWQKIHWTGFIFLPAIFFHFSEVVLEMTGFHRRNLRALGIILFYLLSCGFLWILWKDALLSELTFIPDIGLSMAPTGQSIWFWIWFGILLIITLINFYVTYHRTRTRTSRRRILYLISTSLAILLGTFPLLIFGTGWVTHHVFAFWIINILANLLILLMVFVLGYSVVTFCVNWSNRVVRLRLIEWILRGPATAGVTLAVVTIFRRGSIALNIHAGGWTSLLTVLAILFSQYFITIAIPWVEKNNFSGYGMKDYQFLDGVKNMMFFSSELEIYLESLLSVICDRFQSKGAFIATLTPNNTIDLYVKAGTSYWEDVDTIKTQILSREYAPNKTILDDQGILQPIFYHESVTNEEHLLAILGVNGSAAENFDENNESFLRTVSEQIQIALWQRWYLSSTVNLLSQFSQNEKFTSFRKVGILNPANILPANAELDLVDVSSWVRDALTHYWGGPRLTDNPLIELEIVKQELDEEKQNTTNALRAIIKKGLERIRPDGDRNISGEWTLYNIIELKFIEGLKVREVAQRLAISEADLYRKQKVAIEELAKAILLMENENQQSKEREDRWKNLS